MQADALSGHRVVELQAPGMQKHAFESGLGRWLLKLTIPLKITVFVVARNRMALRGQMHPDLVRAPGLDGHFEQGGPLQASSL